MKVNKAEGVYGDEDDDDDTSSDDDEEDDEEEEGNDDNNDNDDENDDDNNTSSGLRSAACALSVCVGSFFDPPSHPGLSHFLEHMLFMGTEKYPSENHYDSTLSKWGGYDNAYTELETTVFNFDCPQVRMR